MKVLNINKQKKRETTLKSLSELQRVQKSKTNTAACFYY
jgi:hypothetical protein